MERRTREAFSLVELLIVIAIIGLLAALLMPAISAAWQTALLTQCRQNLKTIYKANGIWQAESNTTRLVRGSTWISKLGRYVDNVGSVFVCPVAAAQGFEFGRKGYNPLLLVDIEFDIFTGGEYRYTVAPGDQWSRITKTGADQLLIEIDDEGWSKGQKDFQDIRFTLFFENGHPTRIFVEENWSWSIVVNRFNLVVQGKTILEDWTQHVGEFIDIPEDVYQVSNYGLSKGTYEAGQADVWRVDPKIFFVLDYPKPVADYNRDGREDDWCRYFIDDPAEWDARYNTQGGVNWQDYQALRHFGKANVLFCDGHVELLGLEDLHEGNTRWRYTGR